MYAADRSRRMQDNGGIGEFRVSVDDGFRLMILQKVLHQKPAGKLAEHERVQLAHGFQHGNGVFAAHGAFQQDNVSQAQKLPVTHEPLHDLRKSKHLGNHQIGDFFPFDHGADALIIIQIEMINEGYGSPRHVQAVERENRLRLLRADQPHAGTVVSVNVYGGESFRVSLPITEHLAVGVLPIPVVKRHAVQALLAAGIQFLDKGPAFLIRYFTVLDAGHELFRLFFFCCEHFIIPSGGCRSGQSAFSIVHGFIIILLVFPPWSIGVSRMSNSDFLK